MAGVVAVDGGEGWLGSCGGFGSLDRANGITRPTNPTSPPSTLTTPATHPRTHHAYSILKLTVTVDRISISPGLMGVSGMGAAAGAAAERIIISGRGEY